MHTKTSFSKSVLLIAFTPSVAVLTCQADSNLTNPWISGDHNSSISPANFSALWQQIGSNAADIDGEADYVDFEDFAIFSNDWQDFCPDDWQLK